MDVRNRAIELSQQIITWRRDLHQIPEVGLNCNKTREYICKRLDEMGIAYRTYEKHSGVTVVLGKPAKKVIALRADMDALNIKEENKCDYASKNENMHACGHDAHTAMLLAAAKILKENENSLNGQVKLIFQPDEEALNGAPAMIADGVLEDPKVDEMYALHVGSIVGKGHKPGELLYKKGAIFASSDGFRIEISGCGGHSSTPQKAINPILVATEYIMNVQSLIDREISPDSTTVLTFTGIDAGNQTCNIIPDTAIIYGGFRSFSAGDRNYIMKRMPEILEHITAAYNAKGKFIHTTGCSPVLNDPVVTERFIRSAGKILPSEYIVELETGTMGGEDCSFFFEKVPGCYVVLYNPMPSDDGNEYPHHNSRFAIDDSLLYIGTAVFVQAVMDEIGG